MAELIVQDDAARREKLVNLFFGSVLFEKVTALPETITLKCEDELRDEVGPTQTDFALKKQLWKLGDEAAAAGLDSVPVIRIFGDFCSKPYFYNKVMNDHARLAWLFCVPKDVSTLVEEAFHFGLNRIRKEILTMPVTEKSAPIILKAFQYFADRNLGAVTQRVETKSLHVSIDGKTDSTHLTKEEIQAKIKELESIMDRQQVIEIEGKSETSED